MIRGKSRPVRQEISIEAAIHNRFDIEVRDSRTGEIRQKAQAYNIICDALWTRMLYFAASTDRSWFKYILYGGGSGTPAAEDTALFDKIGAVRVHGPNAYPDDPGLNEVTVLDAVNGVLSVRRSNYIDENTAVGETITEIGIGYDDTNIVTHAMLQDMNGNPISIDKTSTDIITFYATVYVHWDPAGYASGKLHVLPLYSSDWAAGNHNILYSLATGEFGYQAAIFPGSGASVEALTGSAGVSTSIGFKSGSCEVVDLVADTEGRTISFSLRFGVNVANGELRGFTVFFGLLDRNNNRLFEDSGLYVDADAFNHSTWAITGEAVGTGDGTTTAFGTAFPIRSGATVYVDGAADASAVVRTGVLDTGNPGKYFDGINPDGTLRPRHALNTPLTSEAQANGKVWYYRNTYRLAVNAKGNSFSKVEVSDDLTTWTELTGWPLSTPSTALYWRVTFQARLYTALDDSLLYTAGSANNIVFPTPPAAGAVITVDYVPDCIPKDTDHVFDLGVAISLGEYTGS